MIMPLTSMTDALRTWRKARPATRSVQIIGMEAVRRTSVWSVTLFDSCRGTADPASAYGEDDDLDRAIAQALERWERSYGKDPVAPVKSKSTSQSNPA